MATPLSRWGDDRLDDLKRRVDEMEPIVHSVGVMRAEMKSLSRELSRNSEATHETTKQLEGLTLEPLTRGRQMRSQLAIAISSAVVGGGLAVLGAVIASGH